MGEGMDGIVYCKSRERRGKRAKGKRKKRGGRIFRFAFTLIQSTCPCRLFPWRLLAPPSFSSLACCYSPLLFFPLVCLFCVLSLFVLIVFNSISILRIISLLLTHSKPLLCCSLSFLVVSFSIVSIFLSTSTDLQEF